MNDTVDHWPVYVINLAKNTERLAHITTELQREDIAFSVFNAVNGWELSEDSEDVVQSAYSPEINRRKGKYPLVGAEIGCYLSHIGVWQAVLESGVPGAFIFEDDFRVVGELKEVITSLSHDESDWDIVKLFSLDDTPWTIGERPLMDGFRLTVPFRVPTCTLGYGVTAEAARRLVKWSVPFGRPIDDDHKFFWEHGLQVSLVLPAPITVGKQDATTDTVGGLRYVAKVERGYSWGQVLRGFRFQLRFTAALYYHRLIRRIQ